MCTRYFEDALTASCSIGQAVLLAAGMDPRAYRFDLPADLVWFELDRAPLLTAKDRDLADAGAVPRCDRRPVAADLTGDWPHNGWANHMPFRPERIHTDS